MDNNLNCSFDAAPKGTGILDIGTVPELANVGGVAVVKFDGEFNNTNVIILRMSETKFNAFCSVCPHEGKRVYEPLDSLSDLICRAHHTHFSPKDGFVKFGPAEKGLTQYSTDYDSKTNMLRIRG